MGKDTTYYRRILFEFISITFAVVLGFIVTECNDDRKQRIEAQNSLNFILQELRDNQVNLEYLQLYYTTIIDNIENLDTNDIKIDYLSDIPGWKGINPPLIQNSSYELALQSGSLKHLDDKLVHQLAKVNATHDAFTNFIRSSVGFSTLDEYNSSIEYNIRLIYRYSQYADLYLNSLKGLADKHDINLKKYE
ncbi:MAG: hypothetical protein AAFO07_17895 [Bacteroidota bacterium]